MTKRTLSNRSVPKGHRTRGWESAQAYGMLGSGAVRGIENGMLLMDVATVAVTSLNRQQRRSQSPAGSARSLQRTAARKGRLVLG